MNADAASASEASLEYGFLVPVIVYYDDLDPLGMLHNSRYFALVERAWVTYLHDRGIGYSKDWEVLDDAFGVVKQQRISYELPISGIGEYGIHIWVERIGRTSLTFGFRLCSADGSITHARGSRTFVHLDRQTLRPAEFSPEGRVAIEKIMGPATD